MLFASRTRNWPYVMKKLNKITLVDDDVIIGMVSKRLLEQMQCATTVAVYADSFQALSALVEDYAQNSDSKPNSLQDLVFLDIEMPGLGGFEILDRLRAAVQAKQGSLEHVHFVIITSHKGEKEIAKAKDYGVKAILEKPLRIGDIDKLLTQLHVMEDAVGLEKRAE